MVGAGVAAGDLGCGEAVADVGFLWRRGRLPGGGGGLPGGAAAGAEDGGNVDDALVWFPRGG